MFTTIYLWTIVSSGFYSFQSYLTYSNSSDCVSCWGADLRRLMLTHTLLLRWQRCSHKYTTVQIYNREIMLSLTCSVCFKSNREGSKQLFHNGNISKVLVAAMILVTEFKLTKDQRQTMRCSYSDHSRHRLKINTETREWCCEPQTSLFR